VILARGQNKYSVRFDNGTIKEYSSKSLRTERDDAEIPLDEVTGETRGETLVGIT